MPRYYIRSATAWAIHDNMQGGDIVLEVTSRPYADFLCAKLNAGSTLAEINARPHPDYEFYEQQRSCASLD